MENRFSAQALTIVSKLASLVEWNLKLIAKEGRSGFPLLLGTRISRVFSSIPAFREKQFCRLLKLASKRKKQIRILISVKSSVKIKVNKVSRIFDTFLTKINRQIKVSS